MGDPPGSSGGPINYAYEKKCEELSVRPNKLVNGILTQLDLTDLTMELVYLGAKGVLALVSVIRLLRSLQTISLKNCQLTNEAVVMLANVCKIHPSISKLDLSDNTITLPAAKALLDLATENPNVVAITLNNTDISDNYIQRITLQVEQNAGRSQPHKDNILIDEETRGISSDPTEEWEWNSNYKDKHWEAEIQERDIEEDKKGLQAIPFDPDDVSVSGVVVVGGAYNNNNTSSSTNNHAGGGGGGFLRRASSDGQLNVLLHSPVLHSQSVTDILRQLVEKNLLWTDPDFPPEASSIWTKLARRHQLRHNRAVVWKRASDLGDNNNPPELWPQDAPLSAPVQGEQLGDCWFINALGLVYRWYPGLLKRLFVASYPELGLYHLQFCKCGQWMEVVIDDWLPCSASTGQLLFGSCKDGKQLWCALLEKAYAKLHGGYDRISLGSTAHALTDLTAGQCSNVTISSLKKAKEMVVSGELWEALRGGLMEGAILGCTSRVDGHCKELASTIGNGLSPNRTYGLVDMTHYKEWNLVKLHDPWRLAEWGGKFSSSSESMTEDLRSSLGYTEEQQQAGFVWMSFEDFATYFNKIYLLRCFGDSVVTIHNNNQQQQKGNNLTPSPAAIGVDVSRWHCIRIIGEWYQRTAGGKFREQNWTENPQYLVRVRERNTRVFINLNQFDARLSKTEKHVKYDFEIGFYVISAPAESKISPTVKKKYYSGRKDTVYSAVYVASREVSTEVRLQPDKKYLVIPCTKLPNQETKFGLTLWSPSPVTCTEINDQSHEYRAKGWWRRNTAGGRITGYETWVNNPQFVLRMKQSASVCVTLHQQQTMSTDSDKKATTTGTSEGGVPQPLYHIAFYVFKGSTAIANYDSKQVVAFTDFLPYKTVFSTLDLEGGDYIIIPMTWTKGQETTFEVTVYTTAMVTLQKIQRVVEKTAL
eukprot:TRINITY_DN66796_c5_g1_i1.p1 TRINITY_DN66796_c5_g1~~TRINITY_DN66796_c5_g1_i1.p1  ORF type:complete len:932 (-),score=78.20 TRINITY_DN66796_c5_g1_i1:1670-4465(-)